MGGVMILFSIGVSTLLWANLANPYVWICLFVLFGYGAIGFVDDFRKITRKKYRWFNCALEIFLDVSGGISGDHLVVLVGVMIQMQLA